MKIKLHLDEGSVCIEYLNKSWFYGLHSLGRLIEVLVLNLTEEVYYEG